MLSSISGKLLRHMTDSLVLPSYCMVVSFSSLQSSLSFHQDQLHPYYSCSTSYNMTIFSENSHCNNPCSREVNTKQQNWALHEIMVANAITFGRNRCKSKHCNPFCKPTEHNNERRKYRSKLWSIWLNSVLDDHDIHGNGLVIVLENVPLLRSW